MIKDLITKLNKFKKLLSRDVNKAIREILKSNKYLEDVIQGLIAERLTKTGIDSEGNKLKTDGAIYGQAFGLSSTGGVYSPANKEKKDRSYVDLYDTGTLLNSAKIIYRKNEIYVKYSLKKEDGNVYDNFKLSYNSEKDFEDKVLDLSKEEIEIFNRYLLDEINKYYKTEIEKIFS